MKYKCWDIEQHYDDEWCAVHENYDPTPYEPDGAWGDDEHLIYGCSEHDVIKQIDEWEEGNE